MLEVKRKAVLPRELRRIRASALTGDKKYGSVMDVLQIVYGQDFGAILKDYVDTHQEELYKKGIMPDSLFIRLGGIGKPYIETNYDQPSKAFFLDVVVDCLLDGEHYQKCVSFYIRYKMSFCAMDPRCFLWKTGLYRSDANDELRDTNRTKADGNLLPKITAAKYDEIVDDLLESYNPEALDAPGPVDVYKIADGMKLAVRELLIPDYNILGQLHFWPGTIEYLDKDGSKKVSRANSLDIFINKLSCSTMVAKRSSLAHEIGHLFCSRMFELLQIMAGKQDILIHLASQGLIDEALFNQERSALIAEARHIQKQIQTDMNDITRNNEVLMATRALIQLAEKKINCTAFDEALFEDHVDHIRVEARNRITFVLKCGLELREKLTMIDGRRTNSCMGTGSKAASQ